jgi:hypothetical protein
VLGQNYLLNNLNFGKVRNKNDERNWQEISGETGKWDQKKFSESLIIFFQKELRIEIPDK